MRPLRKSWTPSSAYAWRNMHNHTRTVSGSSHSLWILSQPPLSRPPEVLPHHLAADLVDFHIFR
eukprot:4106881-Prymnesium_polylepis.5